MRSMGRRNCIKGYQCIINCFTIIAFVLAEQIAKWLERKSERESMLWTGDDALPRLGK